MTIEKQIVEIIAWDRLDKPISSLSGKIKRNKPKLAANVDLSGCGYEFDNGRVFARYEESDENRARGLREGIQTFKEMHPKYGKILEGVIQEERVKREKHLYFGMTEGSKLSSNDYMAVMTDLGFTQFAAHNLYPELMKTSYKLAKKRNESERSILIS